MTLRGMFWLGLTLGLVCGLAAQDRRPDLLPFPAGYGRQPIVNEEPVRKLLETQLAPPLLLSLPILRP